MSPAIFLYTLIVKLRSLPVLYTMLFCCVLLPLALSQLTAAGGTQVTSPLIEATMQSASIALVLAFIVQKDAFADTRQQGEGEYLSLLFTRPVPRYEYVISKWLAAAFCTCLALLLQSLVFHLAQVVNHRVDCFWAPDRFLDIVLQSLSAAAVVSVINAIPRRLGVWVFILLTYSAVFTRIDAPERAQVLVGTKTTVFLAAYKTYCNIINSILLNNINSYDLLSSLHPDWGALIAFLSNITLYLLFAIYLLNKREFFYASE